MLQQLKYVQTNTSIREVQKATKAALVNYEATLKQVTTENIALKVKVDQKDTLLLKYEINLKQYLERDEECTREIEAISLANANIK